MIAPISYIVSVLSVPSVMSNVKCQMSNVKCHGLSMSNVKCHGISMSWNINVKCQMACQIQNVKFQMYNAKSVDLLRSQ